MIVTPSVAAEEQIIEVDGLPIRYLEAGTGPPLVLLHGAGDNALDWRWVIPNLAATHRVYAPDLPGSPDSARPAADYSPAFFERFIAAFVDALEIGRATFIGNSFGGLIALRLALSPGYLEAHLTVLRALVDPGGQREVLVNRLPSLKIPTLVVWGARDRVFPESQAREASIHLQDGSLALISDCGHMPHVECPERFMAALGEFLGRQVHH